MRISQARARALRKRVNELEKQIYDMKRSWGKEYPEGVHLMTLDKDEANGTEDSIVVRVSRALGHPVVVTEYQGALHFYGVKMP